MNQYIAVVLSVIFSLLSSSAQNENAKKIVRINGKAASSLISLFTNGSDVAKKELSRTNKLVVRDLEVYEGGINSDDPRSGLVYWASGEIGDAKVAVEEKKGADQLFSVFEKLGLVQNAGLGQSILRSFVVELRS